MRHELLHAAFGGGLRFNLLQTLVRERATPLSLAEISEAVGVRSCNLIKLLGAFVKRGLVVKTGAARHWQYQLSKDPATLPLRLLDQPAVIEVGLKKVLEQFQGIEVATIFGSYARGEMDRRGTASDVDVLVIGDCGELRLNAALKPLSRLVEREIHATVLTRERFEQLKSTGDGFIATVLSQNLVHLKGQL